MQVFYQYLNQFYFLLKVFVEINPWMAVDEMSFCPLVSILKEVLLCAWLVPNKSGSETPPIGPPEDQTADDEPIS